MEFSPVPFITSPQSTRILATLLRRIITSLSAVSMSIAVANLFAADDSSACEAIVRDAWTAAASGRLDQADLQLSRLVVSDSLQNERRCQGVALNNLAVIRQRQGRLDEVERYATRSLSVLEKDPLNRPFLMYPLATLGDLFLARRQFNKARAVIAEIKSFPATDARLNAVLFGMEAQILIVEHRVDEAETKYRAALAQWEEAGRGATQDIVPELTNLANIYIDKRRLTEARGLLDRALRLAEESNDFPDLIGVLNSLGVLCAKRHAWRDAEPYFCRAIAVSEARPDLGRSGRRDVYQNYADILRQSGRKREAKAIDARATALFGSDTRSILVDVDELLPEWKQRK